MKGSAAPGNSRDILSHPLLACALFCLPVIAIIATAPHRVGSGWRTAVWTTALGILGIACLANAARCGRIHCYVTGPFFLMMALVTLLYGSGALSLGRNGWSIIGLIILVGAIVLTCLPEKFFGKYRKDPRSTDHC